MEYCPYCMAELTGPYCSRCGKRAEDAQNGFNLPVGTTLCRQRYVVGRVLGQGGFGVTYLGRDTRLNRAVAIKEYVPSCCAYREKRSQWIVPFPEQAHREFYEKGKRDFLEEVRLTTEVSSGRQHIVEIYDYFEENNTAYLVMEYLNGDSMQDYVKAYGPYRPAYLFSLMRPLMKDMADLHKRDILHRDIAPNNIMHIKSDRLKLIDFGAARRLHGDRTMSIMVHDGFAPPEQFMKKDQGPYTDVYALAATMYFCLTGEVPRNSVARVQEDKLPSLLEKGIRVTQQQNDAVMHALRLRMDERTQDMQQFMDELYDRKSAPEEKQPNQIAKILDVLREKYKTKNPESEQKKSEEATPSDWKADKQPEPAQTPSKENALPVSDGDRPTGASGKTEPANGYGPAIPAQNLDCASGDKTLPAEFAMEPVKVEPVRDESVRVGVPVYDPRAHMASGTQTPSGQKAPERPRPSQEREVPDYHPVATPKKPVDKRLVIGLGAVLLVLLILFLIPIISYYATERKETQAGQINSVETESNLPVESLSWLPGYWYCFDETESCAEYQIQSDRSWVKKRCSLNSDKKQTVSMGTVTVVDEDEVIIDQLRWKYQTDNDCLEPSGQNKQTECMMHFDEQLTLEQLQSQFDLVMKLYEGPEPETMPEPESESSWLDGYWYLFNEEKKYCKEYQFQEDGTYQVQDRVLANGNNRTRVQEGEYSYVEKTADNHAQLFLEDETWRYDEKVGAWYKKEDNIWGTKSQIVMIHSLSRAGVDELDEGYATFMMYNEVDVYTYDGVADSESALIYAYPSVFQEITAENGTYADGTAMKPLEVFLTSINNYWGYRSQDGKQALFYSFWSIPSDFEAKNVLQDIADKVYCDFMVEEESASEADWFRLLMNIDGRWHFIRCEIFEENNELILMEYSFTGESYYDYNSVIAHLEHNLKYITE